jgi:hypothetical protein
MGNRRDLAAAINALAQLERTEGHLDAAENGYDEVLELSRQLQDRETEAIALLNLAMVQIARREPRSAATVQAAHRIVEEIGSRRLRQSVLEVAAGLAASLARWDEAALLFGCAQAQARETGVQRVRADESFLDPFLESTRKALGAEAFALAEARGQALPPAQALAAASVLAPATAATCR